MIDRLKGLVGRLDRWSLSHRLPRVSRRAVSGFLEHEALQTAGGMAYFGMLSIFQLVVLAVVVASFFVGQGEARTFVVDQVSSGTPLDEETVSGIIDSVIESRGTLTIISLGFLIWGALGVFSALSTGISRVFENAPRRPFLQDKLVGLLLMALTGLLALASVAIGVVTGILQRAAEEMLADLPGGGTAVWLIGFAGPILLIFLAFWVVYKVVPNRPVRWGEVLPGAIVATLLWTLLRFGFTWYATSVANYDSAFGPLAAAVTLLVFLYFGSVIVLLGAEFARAGALDDEVAGAQITVADPRLLPVLTEPPPAPAPAPRRRIPAPILIVAAAAIGLLIGRVTKRDEGEYPY